MSTLYGDVARAEPDPVTTEAFYDDLMRVIRTKRYVGKVTYARVARWLEANGWSHDPLRKCWEKRGEQVPLRHTFRVAVMIELRHGERIPA